MTLIFHVGMHKRSGEDMTNYNPMIVKNTVNNRDSKGKFLPGNQEGNRKGRPKKKLCIPDLLNKVGSEKCPDQYLKLINKIYPDIKEISHKEALQRLAYYYAFKGQSWAFNYIADRTEGKVKESDPIDKNQINEITFL